MSKTCGYLSEGEVVGCGVGVVVSEVGLVDGVGGVGLVVVVPDVWALDVSPVDTKSFAHEIVETHTRVIASAMTKTRSNLTASMNGCLSPCDPEKRRFSRGKTLVTLL